MMFVPRGKHTHGPPRPVTKIALLFPHYENILKAAVAQSVKRLATDWMTEGLEFHSMIIEIGIEYHRASYPMSTGDSFFAGKAAGI
jgi:hypothetical protein